jgi:small subunit ribosomal protein S2
MDKKVLEDMFQNAVHVGHRTHKWNPRMKKFIHGERNGVHIINLEKTASYLEEALNFLNKVVAEGKTVLFVSTKPQSVTVLEEAAKKVNMPYVVNKWIPGLLTNFSTVKVRIKYLTDIKEQEASGELEKFTKKEVAKKMKEKDKLEAALGGVEGMKSKPDAVFVLDIVRDQIVVKEAAKLGIPVVGIADTNSDPNAVDYPIPGNDDAMKSLGYFIDKVVQACSARSSKSTK